jgi:hypothetical protein
MNNKHGRLLPRETLNGSSSVCLFARYDPSGVLRRSKAFGTQATATSLSVAADGRVLLTGYFQGTIDLGLGPLVSAGDTMSLQPFSTPTAVPGGRSVTGMNVISS